jgi:hypothetical protein
MRTTVALVHYFSNSLFRNSSLSQPKALSVYCSRSRSLIRWTNSWAATVKSLKTFALDISEKPIETNAKLLSPLLLHTLRLLLFCFLFQSSLMTNAVSLWDHLKNYFFYFRFFSLLLTLAQTWIQNSWLKRKLGFLLSLIIVLIK